jgi:predicted Zn finger-like uncharacterized protein
MIIPCPFCNTKFNIADEQFGSRTLIKFQCSKCKTVFRFDRTRSESLEGEERESPTIPPGPPPKEEKKIEETFESFEPKKPADEDRDLDQATTEMRRGTEEPMKDSYESFEADKPAGPGPEETPSPPPADVAPPDDETLKSYPPPPAEPGIIIAPGVESYDAGPSDFEEKDLAEPTPPQGIQETAETEPREKSTVPPSPKSRAAAREPFTSGPFVLEMEYEWAEKPLKRTSKGARALGFFALVAVFLCAVLFILLTGRNDWNFAAFFDDPSGSIQVALGRKALIKVAPEARDLETSVTEVYTADTANGSKILVVQGEVFNMTVFPKKQIRVYVEIADRSNQVVQSQEVISGITLLTQAQVEEKTLSGLTMYLESERRTADEWIVNSERKVSFQAFFANPPNGAEDPQLFIIRAVAISAVNASSTPAML